MPPLTVERLKLLLHDFVQQTGTPIDLILIGALATEAYGVGSRPTADLDAEVHGPLDALRDFLDKVGVPADLGANISGWSVIALPPGYQERTLPYYDASGVRLRLLHPRDYVIAKLRRGTEDDLEDARRVAQHFHFTGAEIRDAASAAVAASPADTAIFLFRRLVDHFCQTLD
jgi:hypothetical protein